MLRLKYWSLVRKRIRIHWMALAQDLGWAQLEDQKPEEKASQLGFQLGDRYKVSQKIARPKRNEKEFEGVTDSDLMGQLLSLSKSAPTGSIKGSILDVLNILKSENWFTAYAQQQEARHTLVPKDPSNYFLFKGLTEDVYFYNPKSITEWQDRISKINNEEDFNENNTKLTTQLQEIKPQLDSCSLLSASYIAASVPIPELKCPNCSQHNLRETVLSVLCLSSFCNFKIIKDFSPYTLTKIHCVELINTSQTKIADGVSLHVLNKKDGKIGIKSSTLEME